MRVGSVYGHGFDEEGLERLAAAGFSLRPETSRYAGAQLCRFVDVARGPALELIEVEDEDAYVAFVPPGMEPWCPGVSVVVDGGPSALDEQEQALRNLGPYRLHVAYDGGDDPDAPGWTYLNLATPLLPGTFTWLTALDEPRPERPRAVEHENGATAVSGLVFDLPPAELEPLRRLGIGGVELFARPDVPAAALGKRFPLVAVVVEATDLDRVLQAPGAGEVSFAGADAVLLATNDSSWDVLVLEQLAG